jgi:hypothetical protein
MMRDRQAQIPQPAVMFPQPTVIKRQQTQPQQLNRPDPGISSTATNSYNDDFERKRQETTRY